MSGMDINLIVTAAVWGILGFGVLWGILWGALRGTLRSTARLLTAILAIALTLVVMALLTNSFVPQIQEFAVDLVRDMSEEAEEVMDASPALINYVIDLAVALVSPVLFSVIFILLYSLLFFVYLIAVSFFPKKKTNPISAPSRLAGVLISVACAILVAVGFLMPFTKYIEYVAETYPEVQETGLIPEDTVPEWVEDELSAAEKNTAVKTVNLCGGNLFFKLTSSIDNSTATEELSALIDLVTKGFPAVQQLMDDNKDAADGKTELNMDVLNEELIPLLDDSPHIKFVLAEVLSYSAKQWRIGETFLGVNIHEMLGDYASSADKILERLCLVTSETVAKDIRFFSDSMVALSRTYVYLLKVADDVHNYEDLGEDVVVLLETMTPEAAEILRDTLNTDLVGSASLGDTSANTVVGIIGDSLVDVSYIEDPEERRREAEAINVIISYSSKTRDDVSEEDLLNTVLDSNVLSQQVIETSKNNGSADGEKQVIEVSASQKASLDAEIEARLEDPAYAKDHATLEALRALFAVHS